MKALASKLASTMKEEKSDLGVKRPDQVPASLLAGASFPLPDNWHADEMTGIIGRDTIHSMLRRRKGWNYRGPGLYMVTLTLADRSRGWMGELVVEAPPSKLGKALGSKLPSTGASARELARGCYHGFQVADVEKLALAAVGA